ncbi:MAG: epoxyqueuosine reductase [Anaerotruncus sp.]|nr:epoxyqueuosine reductase [Anaerotruncus sp.]
MKTLAALMQNAQIDQWGVCAFSDVLPLLNVRSKNRIPRDARSVIVVLFGYYIGDYPNRNVSRYAIVDDYHTVLRQKLNDIVENLLNLFKTHWFSPFVDASPIHEVRAAQLAGLGEIGMNGQLLNPIYGSYCFIGEIVTSLPLPPSRPQTGSCTHCGACVAACPTGALSSDGFLKERCRSQITQKKGELTEWEREQIRAGGLVWGCDCCTDACPVNRGVKPSLVEGFYTDIAPVVGQDNAGRLCLVKAYGWRGETVILRNLRILSE